MGPFKVGTQGDIAPGAGRSPSSTVAPRPGGRRFLAPARRPSTVPAPPGGALPARPLARWQCWRWQISLEDAGKSQLAW